MALTAAVAAVAVAAVGTSYSIYSGEQAKSTAKKQADQQAQQFAQQQKQQADQLASQQAQEKAAVQTAKDSLPGIQAQMGADLLTQEQNAYSAMAPKIEDRLNSLGLLQSGALPAEQAKYQAQLEADRQAALGNFMTTENAKLNVDQPIANAAADVAAQQQALTQQFMNQDVNSQSDVARSNFLAGIGTSQGQQIGNLGVAGLGLAGAMYKSPATTPTPTTAVPQVNLSSTFGVNPLNVGSGTDPSLAALMLARQRQSQPNFSYLNP